MPLETILRDSEKFRCKICGDGYEDHPFTFTVSETSAGEFSCGPCALWSSCPHASLNSEWVIEQFVAWAVRRFEHPSRARHLQLRRDHGRE